MLTKSYTTKTGKYVIEYKEPTMRQRMAYTDMCTNTGKVFGSSEELFKLMLVSVNGDKNKPADILLDLPVSEADELLEIRDMLFGYLFPTQEEVKEREKK